MILSGYLRKKYAQHAPMALSASIAFEQSYGMIDGDSASSTELYALLSDLAIAPIDQGFAVTGSVNQRGEVQPIGGVNEKVEAFYDVCAERGLTGTQGVLIPHQNVLRPAAPARHRRGGQGRIVPNLRHRARRSGHRDPDRRARLRDPRSRRRAAGRIPRRPARRRYLDELPGQR